MADIIDEIIEREGSETNDPLDTGGRTKYGISERANPDLWRDGPPTYAQARARYTQRYILTPGFDRIPNPHLRNQVIDFGVNAGTDRAAKLLQTAVGTRPDGKLGPRTLACLAKCHPKSLNNTYVILREAFYRKLVDRKPSQHRFLRGWLARARSFYIE